MRRAYTLAVLLAGIAAGWLWLGNAGAGLLGLWLWAGHWQGWRGGTHQVHVVLQELRLVRLSPHRVMGMGRGWRTWEVFSDELDADQYACLRRALKAHFDGRHAPG